jgi:hypothetical protein
MSKTVDWLGSLTFSLCGFCGLFLICTSCISLGLAVFQLAFLIEPEQIIFRVILQFVLILFGWQLVQLHDAPTDIMVLLTTCAIVTSTVGLIIGSVELTIILWTRALVVRLSLYCMLLLAGVLFSPYSKSGRVMAATVETIKKAE